MRAYHLHIYNVLPLSKYHQVYVVLAVGDDADPCHLILSLYAYPYGALTFPAHSSHLYPLGAITLLNHDY